MQLTTSPIARPSTYAVFAAAVTFSVNYAQSTQSKTSLLLKTGVEIRALA